MNKTQKKQFNRSVSANKPKVKQYQTPGPNAYDIRGTYDPRKGFSFGLKCTNEKKKNKNDPEPDFPHLQSDFDRIVNNPNHAEVKYTAPRFKEPKIIEPVIPAKLESLEKRDLTKKLSDRAKVLVSFLGDRQKDLERVLENKERLEQQRQEELEDLINRLPRANNDEDGDYYLNNINYNQVEEKAPQFSMKGRYEHGSIFAMQDSSMKPNPNEEGTDIYGKNVDVNLLRKKVGMVFQKPNPFPMSIYDNIAFGPRTHGIHGKAELDEIVERSLKQAAIWDEVKDRLHKSALGMSGGQQQRLCIARALAIEPDVLLMDEPTSALDPISTSKIEDLVIELKQKYSIVIVTHNMQQAVRISDKTAFFLMGEVVEFNQTSQLFSLPQDERTENYITGRFG